jgi:TonB family protein
VFWSKTTEGQKSIAPVMATLVFAAATLTCLPGRIVLAQAKPPQAKARNFPGVEILTPTNGADFQEFLTHFYQKVRQAWYAAMPESAQLGEKGTVVVGLHIRSDGKLEAGSPVLTTSSGRKALDEAAVKATRRAAPFDHFPGDFSGPTIEIRSHRQHNINS